MFSGELEINVLWLKRLQKRILDPAKYLWRRVFAKTVKGWRQLTIFVKKFHHTWAEDQREGWGKDAPLCNFAPLCNTCASLRFVLPHFVIPAPLCDFFAPLCNFMCLYNTWRVSWGSNSVETKLQKIMIRKIPHPFMTSSFGPTWYWKYDTFISLDCVAHFRPNLVRMILRP